MTSQCRFDYPIGCSLDSVSMYIRDVSRLRVVGLEDLAPEYISELLTPYQFSDSRSPRSARAGHLHVP